MKKMIIHLMKDDAVVGVDANGSIYRYSFGNWLKIGKRFSDGPDAGAERMIKDKGWRKVKVPSVTTMEKWSWDGVAKTPCGCQVEPDGTCKHGQKSWLLITGMI